MINGITLLLSCEHASNAVPPALEPLFRGMEDVLESHRGWDPGAPEIARLLSRELGGKLVMGEVTRMVVDLNRSSDNRRGLYSEVTRKLPKKERDALLAEWWQPFRERVETWSAEAIGAGSRVLHVPVHSFTPELDGKVQQVDVGLLYDPARQAEGEFAAVWQRRLTDALPELRIRMNKPYRGTSDGHTRALRRRFAEPSYMGVEIEMNQAICNVASTARRRLRKGVVGSLRGAMLELSRQL